MCEFVGNWQSKTDSGRAHQRHQEGFRERWRRGLDHQLHLPRPLAHLVSEGGRDWRAGHVCRDLLGHHPVAMADSDTYSSYEAREGGGARRRLRRGGNERKVRKNAESQPSRPAPRTA